MFKKEIILSSEFLKREVFICHLFFTSLEYCLIDLCIFFICFTNCIYTYCLLFRKNKSTLLEFHHDVAIFTTFFLTKYMYLFLKDWGRNSWGFLSVRLWCQLRAWEKNLKESVKDIFIACYSLCEIRFHWSECDKTLRPSVVESSSRKGSIVYFINGRSHSRLNQRRSFFYI